MPGFGLSYLLNSTKLTKQFINPVAKIVESVKQRLFVGIYRFISLCKRLHPTVFLLNKKMVGVFVLNNYICRT